MRAATAASGCAALRTSRMRFEDLRNGEPKRKAHIRRERKAHSAMYAYACLWQRLPHTVLPQYGTYTRAPPIVLSSVLVAAACCRVRALSASGAAGQPRPHSAAQCDQKRLKCWQARYASRHHHYAPHEAATRGCGAHPSTLPCITSHSCVNATPCVQAAAASGCGNACPGDSGM